MVADPEFENVDWTINVFFEFLKSKQRFFADRGVSIELGPACNQTFILTHKRIPRRDAPCFLKSIPRI